MLFPCFCLATSINRTKITSCYSMYSYFTFSRNLKTFTVNLVTTKNNNCDVFPSGVEANLTLQSLVFSQSLTISISNFNYENTTQLVFPISDSDISNGFTLSNFTDLSFAVLDIFSISETTQLQLMTFYELKSNLSNCFQNLKLSILQNNFQVTATPTGVCILQMVPQNLSDTQQQTYISQIDLQINGYVFTFSSSNLLQFLQNYQNSQAISISVTSSSYAQQIIDIRQAAIISALLLITSVQGSGSVALQYTFKDASVAASTDFFSNAYVVLSNNSFYIRFQQNIVQALQFQTLASQSSSCTIRFIGISQTTYINAKQYQYSSSMNSLQIYCYDGASNEVNECIEFYNTAVSNISTNFELNILLFNQSILLGIQKTQLLRIGNCFDMIQVVNTKGQLSLRVYYAKYDQVCNIMFKNTTIINNITLALNIYINQSKFIFNIENTTFNLYSTSYQINNFNDTDIDNATFELEATTSKGVKLLATGNQLLRNDYTAQQAISNVLGGLFVIGAAVITLQKIIEINRKIHDAVHKKKIKM